VRYLYRIEDGELLAYAPGRRDFYRADDGSLWSHESHDWLVAATSGQLLAHRTKDVYYSVSTGEPLYYEDTEPAGPAVTPGATPPAETASTETANGLRLAGT
jgi:hypothetical protein